MSPEKIQIILIIWAFGIGLVGVLFWALSLAKMKDKSAAEIYKLGPSPVRYSSPVPIDSDFIKRGLRYRRLAKIFIGTGCAILFYFFIVKPLLISFADTDVSAIVDDTQRVLIAIGQYVKVVI
jgi:hypothetical protein